MVGERCHGAEPHGHWHSSTLLAALRYDKITAPFLVDGAVDTDVLTVYLQHVLCPELEEGDVVILDNLSTHKIAAVARLINARGAEVRYLPVYSPDLNPIEQAFAKLKAHLRQAAARAAKANRLQSSMNLAIGSALASIGLTVPVVVGASLIFGLPLFLGLPTKEIAMLMLTLLVSAVTLGTGRTNMMQGAVHLVFFAAFLFLA